MRNIIRLVVLLSGAIFTLATSMTTLDRTESDTYGFKNTDVVYSIIAGDTLDFSDASFVDEDGNSYELFATPNVNTYQVGTYDISLIAKGDPKKHVKKVTLHIEEMPCEVKFNNGYYDEENDKCSRDSRATIFWGTNYYPTKTEATGVYEIAETLVGIGGNCQSVMMRFYTLMYGKQINDIEAEWVRYEEAIPGDMIFYENGGRGSTHVAVYLGDGMALQGNYNGRAIITSIYLPYATAPNFAHPIINFVE